MQVCGVTRASRLQNDEEYQITFMLQRRILLSSILMCLSNFYIFMVEFLQKPQMRFFYAIINITIRRHFKPWMIPMRIEALNLSWVVFYSQKYFGDTKELLNNNLRICLVFLSSCCVRKSCQASACLRFSSLPDNKNPMANFASYYLTVPNPQSTHR